MLSGKLSWHFWTNASLKRGPLYDDERCGVVLSPKCFCNVIKFPFSPHFLQSYCEVSLLMKEIKSQYADRYEVIAQNPNYLFRKLK